MRLNNTLKIVLALEALLGSSFRCVFCPGKTNQSNKVLRICL